MNTKRILAILGIVVLVGMYIVTLVMAFINKPGMTSWFNASLFCTIIIPILIWVYIKAYEWTKKKKDSDN